MSPLSRPFRLAATALVALVAVALVACSKVQAPAATVNGHRITDQDLKANIPLFEFLASLQNTPCGQAQGTERPDAACTRFALTNLIEEQLVLPYAQSHHLSVARSDIDTTLSSLEQQEGKSRLASLLKDQGLTTSDLQGLVSRLLLLQKVERTVVSEQLTDDRLRQLYEENKLQFTQLHAAHILVQSRKEAAKIANEATPENFAKLATEFSKDPGSAKNGGDLGVIPAGQLDKDFVAAALKLSPGQISEPVHTTFGWHVIMLISVDVIPFEKARDQLLAQAGTGAFTDWLKMQVSSASVEVNPRYGRFDSSTGTVVPINSTATGSPSSPAPALS